MRVRVRLAGLQDLSAIVALGKRITGLPDSNYVNFPYNAVIARRTVKHAMSNKDSRVWVTEYDGEVCGALIGEIGPMPMTHYFAATDLIFIAERGGDRLLDAFVAWCKLRGVARIDMGISAGPGRDAAIRRAFRRKGFTYSGPMFHLNMLPEGESQ